MRLTILLFFIQITTVNQLFCQSVNTPQLFKTSANSNFAMLEINQGTRKLFPTFNGYWHAFALVSPEFSNISAQIISKIDQNIPINGKISCLMHVRFKPHNLPLVLSDENLIYLDISGRLNAPRILNDTSRILSEVNKVENGVANGLKQNYTGQNSLVGIVDIGFQTNHATFFDNNGQKTRIVSMWHQQHATGTPPMGFNYGSEYKDTQEILTAIDQDGTHGTHVAGIAAGSGLASPNFKFRGMAPEAQLSFVGIKYANDTLGGSALGDYIVANPTIIDGYKYLFQLADRKKLPIVTNLSWGMHTGPHDGSSLFDLSINSLVGPGKIVVGAAGNDGGNQMHLGKLLSGDTVYTIAMDRSRKDYRNENVYIDAWGDPNKKFSIQVSLLDTFGNIVVSGKWNRVGDCINCGAYKELLVAGNDTLSVLWSEQIYPINNKPNALVIAESNNAKARYIQFGFTSESGFHAWNSGQAYRWTSGTFSAGHNDNPFSKAHTAGSRDFSVGENGGSGNRTLSVGAYVARNQWINFQSKPVQEPWLQPGEIASFSSRGPLPSSGDFSKTRQKPDIIAPGHHIVSALHKDHYASWMDNQLISKQTWRNAEQYYVQFSGTSMAAPHVAGVVALYLQANPNLSPEDIKNLWRFYHTRDQFTSTDSNSNAGFGKITAWSAIEFLEKYLVIKPSLNHSIPLVFNTITKELSLLENYEYSFNEEIIIVNLQGKTVKKHKITSNQPIPLNELNSGLYCYYLTSNSIKQSGKFYVP